MRRIGLSVLLALTVSPGCGGGHNDGGQLSRGRVIEGNISELPKSDQDFLACLRAGGVSVGVRPTTRRLALAADKAARAGHRVNRNYRYGFALLPKDRKLQVAQRRTFDACFAKAKP
jgi:hypothetical protein